MPDANLERKELEQRLMHAVEALLALGDVSTDWLKGDEFRTVTRTLYDLVQYHKSHGEIRETVIGFEELNAFLIVTRQLNYMLRNEGYADAHETIREKLGYLEFLMDNIVSEGYSKMYYDEDE